MFDVIVIGGGHAGVEAACAAARCRAVTVLVTFDTATVGAMSCNPAIGGIGKGHIVREIDAFDGIMARAADHAAIHYRMLNRSKGAAVRGPRVQADRKRYAAFVRQAVAAQPGLTVIAGEAASLIVKGGRAVGVMLADGQTLTGRAIILATGTFLGGRMFRGSERHEGGRIAERAANTLAGQLRELGLPIARLKTGTPPRLDGRTIDWVRIAAQPSDTDAWTMSTMSDAARLPQVACGITRTTAATHDAIRVNLDRSPLFTGAIEAEGPRYCPSIEDKVQRFGDRDGHQVFLEPEGLDDATVYPNGLSTSLPTDTQHEMVASIPGLERAIITTPGYAVEYDYLDPRALDRRLALSALPGIFCAGQINGTTGYEEAAGQGLVAGLNAAAHALERDPVVLDRASSYLGVMTDDLTLQGVTEPYRMLTARAEYRLSLRADNAETRLGQIATAAGCLSRARERHQQDRAEQRLGLKRALQGAMPAPARFKDDVTTPLDAGRRAGDDWLRMSGVTLADLLPDMAATVAPDIIDEVVEDARYAPYMARQTEEVARMRGERPVPLPATLRYDEIAGLSNEMVERFSKARPASLAEAARIRGVTPAALSAVLLHARRVG